ncbi:SphA family protein [Rubritalea marina]|uniref:SphA family protein n=1 Tax=Rubritalea marina TaxID=361055 RepID=UPI000366CA23|nr:transporter [Rubritalea marina]
MRVGQSWVFGLLMCFGGGLDYSLAEEGGSGHYMPGSMSSFVDSVAPKPTFLARYNLLNYSGERSLSMPIAGLTAETVDADSWANGLTLFWRPDWGSINDTWGYAMSVSIPYVNMKVSADVEGGGGAVLRRTDREQGLGDVIFQPLMFNQHLNESLNINYRLSVYAPTGDYKVGRLANPGKNYWSIEPTVGVMYFNPSNGRECSFFTGLTINTENAATQYQTGTQLHFENTVAQHFPLKGGLAGIGFNAFFYQQVEGDRGAGASFGDFKGRSYGVGPVLSYSTKVDDHPLTAEFKWLPEIETKNRLKGNSVWLKVLYTF